MLLSSKLGDDSVFWHQSWKSASFSVLPRPVFNLSHRPVHDVEPETAGRPPHVTGAGDAQGGIHGGLTVCLLAVDGQEVAVGPA